jgi:myo-inositol 2-dehydrogenase / D-chiro-inositol 1-dehydrogenase
MNSSDSINRRTFIRNSTVSLTAPAIIGLAGTLGAAESNGIKAGFIGTGGRGQALLGHALKSPGVNIVAICDIDPDSRARAAEMASAHKPATFSYYKKLLELKELDAVFVATPPYLHKHMIVDVMDSGRSCYAEKPLALTVEEIDAVVEAAGRARGVLQVGQQIRYHAGLHKLIGKLHDGLIGKIGWVRGQRYADWDGPGSRGAMKWLWSIEQSGDQIVEQSVHELDLINWIMNDHPIRAAGLGGQNIIHEPSGASVLDSYGLTFDFPGGRQGVFSMIKYAPYTNSMGGRIINAYGEKGSVDVQLSGPSTVVWRGENAPEPTKYEEAGIDFGQRAVDDFFRCARTGEKPFCDAETGRTAALTALLGRKAIYEQRVVTWDELLREGAPVKPLWY